MYFMRRLLINEAGPSCERERHNLPILPISPHSRLLPAASPTCSRHLKLALCSVGLLCSYLIWGVLQERVMTINYATSHHKGKAARTNEIVYLDSQFLVLVNRVLSALISVALLWAGGPHLEHLLTVGGSTSTVSEAETPGIFDFAYCSLSNIVSSWCQYEALKYLTFPSQVVGKACKIIPVMLMSILVTRSSFRWHEFLTAGLISLGVGIFLLTSSEAATYSQPRLSSLESVAFLTGEDKITTELFVTASGLLLLSGYVASDSFTSNWQDRLFKRYRISSLTMIAYVNTWSVLLTLGSMGQQPGTVAHSWHLVTSRPLFLLDCLWLSTSSALGQLIIFVTIAQFGAVTFTIIMTFRQVAAIYLSSLIYNHEISLVGWAGILIMFGSLIARSLLSANQKISSTNSLSANSKTSSMTSDSPDILEYKSPRSQTLVNDQKLYSLVKNSSDIP